MPNIIHKIGIKGNMEDVFKAISTIEGLSRWWTESTSGSTAENGHIKFQFRTPTGELKGEMNMRVRKSVPGKSVQWICQDGPADWIGTNFTFDLSQQGEHVIVLFGHRDWKEESESMAHCSTKWATFMLSLRDHVEKGKGRPAPNDLKIDNWN